MLHQCHRSISVLTQVTQLSRVAVSKARNRATAALPLAASPDRHLEGTSLGAVHLYGRPSEIPLVKKPEQHAHDQIGAALAAAGWVVQDVVATNLAAGCGVSS